MAKVYYVKFSSGDVRLNFGLAPTFVCFNNNGSAVTPPAIAEVTGATGIYSFTYGTTTPIAFLIDGFTTGLGNNRYVSGSIDPADRGDEYGNTLAAYGLTAIALGTTGVALGTTNVALGTTSVAWGAANNTVEVNQGTTLVAVGNTAIALGTTAVAYWAGPGTTLAALGTTSVSWGLANNTALTNQGTTLVAVGNTSIALGATGIAFGTTNVALGTTNVALGTTNFAIGTTILSYVSAMGTSETALEALIGNNSSSYLPPTTLFGYMQRIQQDLEGNETFTKSSGVLQYFDSTGATQLFSKTIANSASLVTRS